MELLQGLSSDCELPAGWENSFSSVSLSYFLFLSHPNSGTVQLETLETGIFAIWLITQGTLEKGRGGNLDPCWGMVDNAVKQLAWNTSVWMLSASWDQGRKMVSLISSAVFEKHEVKVGVDRFFSRASDNSASSHWSSYTDVVIQTWFQMATTGGVICPFPIGPNVEFSQ